MKHRFNVCIRGNINSTSSEELSAAIAEGVKTIEGFTIESNAIEVWVDAEGNHRDFNGLKRFTISLTGIVLTDSEESVRGIINSFCKTYPEFKLTWQSIQGWMSAGSLQDFNDDGTVYTQPVNAEETTPADEASTDTASA